MSPDKALENKPTPTPKNSLCTNKAHKQFHKSDAKKEKNLKAEMNAGEATVLTL